MACPGHRRRGEDSKGESPGPLGPHSPPEGGGGKGLAVVFLLFPPSHVAEQGAWGCRVVANQHGRVIHQLLFWLHMWACQGQCQHIEDMHGLLDLRSACSPVS